MLDIISLLRKVLLSAINNTTHLKNLEIVHQDGNYLGLNTAYKAS